MGCDGFTPAQTLTSSSSNRYPAPTRKHGSCSVVLPLLQKKFFAHVSTTAGVRASTWLTCVVVHRDFGPSARSRIKLYNKSPAVASQSPLVYKRRIRGKT